MIRRIRDRIQPAPWEWTLYILAFSQLITAVGFSTIFPFLPLYVKDLGSTMGLSIELLSGLVFSAQAVTMMITSPIWGALADRFGRKLMIQRSAFGGALLVFLMAFVRSAEELVLLRAIQGDLVTGMFTYRPRDLSQVRVGVDRRKRPSSRGADAQAQGQRRKQRPKGQRPRKRRPRR